MRAGDRGRSGVAAGDQGGAALATVRAVLIIENLTSFHRQVRECPQDDVIVVYLGGFPNSAVLGLLRRLAAAPVAFHHWGDVDAGGVRIVRHVREALGGAVRLYAMDVDTARRHGMPFPAPPRIAADSGDGLDLLALVDYRRGPEPRWLEQETLSPRPVP